MAKEKIEVYDLQNLSKEDFKQHTLLVERFGPYLKRHPKKLHSAHRHSFFHLVMFTKGAGTHTVDFIDFPVVPFQIYFMIPGQIHSWQFDGEVDGYIVNFSDSLFRSFLLDSNYLERFSFFCGITEDCICQLPPVIGAKVEQLFIEMLHQTPGDGESELSMTRLLLMQLFMLIEKTATPKSNNEVLHHKQLLLKKFRQLIELNYRILKLPKDYADLLCVTPTYLNVLCQELVNKTAGELIRNRVLLEAKRLLINAPNLNISEVAADLHFQDKSYFNRFFKKYAGVTPDDFRRQKK